MSFTERDEKVEQLFEPKSSDSEDNCQNEEEVGSEESFLDSLSQFKNITIDNNLTGLPKKKNTGKKQLCRLTVSLRYGKCNRQLRSKAKAQRVSKQKKSIKSPDKSKIFLEKQTEIPKKGKRCRLGGKAKGKPPEEESRERRDSDEDSDNVYFSRISLGYFQKINDNSGASTSYQWEEDCENTPSSYNEEKIGNNTSEEMELLELQKWGKTALISSYNRKIDDLEAAEDIKPDKL